MSMKKVTLILYIATLVIKPSLSLEAEETNTTVTKPAITEVSLADLKSPPEVLTLNYHPIQQFVLQKTSVPIKHQLRAHTGSIASLAFCPDSKILATCSDNRTVILWNVETNTIKYSLTGHTNVINTLTFSPDGKTLATGSRDCTAILWDVETGIIKKTLTGHTDWITSIAFSPDGYNLITCSWHNTAIVWDLSKLIAAENGFPQLIITQWELLEKLWSVIQNTNSQEIINPLRLTQGQWITFRSLPPEIQEPLRPYIQEP